MSEIKTDKLTGVGTAGVILVTGEGNSTTTNLQQGLAKAWNNTNSAGTTINDSFNISSLGDTSTGRQNHNVTNNFANANFVPTLSVAANYNQQWTSSLTTGGWRTNNFTGSEYIDIQIRTISSGDLA